MAASTRQFSSFCVGSTAGPSLMVSHLLFANDTLVFYDADPSQIANLRAILARFEEVSGLQDRKSTRLNTSHPLKSRMPSSA